MARKYYNIQYFKPNKTLSIKCTTQDTSYGFRHVAEITKENASWGTPVDYAKACYHNRTYERFCYEAVINEAIDNCNLIKQKTRAKNKVANDALGKVKSNFATIATVAKLGEIFTDNDKQSNDWKARMLKAGLGDGLIMPDDWGSLTESEKTKRLNAVIAHLGN